MSPLSIFGFASVLLMLIAYSVEARGRIWTLLFAFGCFSSAVYAYLAGALPFAFVEAVWGIVALRKWRKRTD